MAAEEIGSSTLNTDLSKKHENWKHEMEMRQLQVDVLQARLQEVKSYVRESGEDAKSETEILLERVKTAAILMTYLKTKARVMAIPDLAYKSCGIRTLEGFGPADKNGIPLSWARDVDLSSVDSPDEVALMGTSRSHGSLDEEDGAYLGELLNSVQMITRVMEALVRRAVMAEYESELEKDKVNLGQEEIRQKSIQIQTMSTKLQEVERIAVGANGILSDMKQQVVDLVEETSRQKQRAVENEVELCRVKRDFESLKSYVSTLISVRETLVSSEKQVQTLERLFERLVRDFK